MLISLNNKNIGFKTIKMSLITNEHIARFVQEAHRAGDAKLMLCSSGNLSWRVGDEAIVSGTGSWLPKITADRVSVCRIADGIPVRDFKPSMASTFHLGILRNRTDINVVLHFQSGFSTTIACIEHKPSVFNVTAEVPCYVGREVPIVPYYRPGSPELAKAVTEAMKDHDCCLLSKHGQVVCGKDFDDAFQKAMFFEMACGIIVRSGFKYTTLTDAEIEDLEIYVLGKKTK